MSTNFGLIHDLAKVEIETRKHLRSALHEVCCGESLVEDALTLAQLKVLSRWILERWESDSFDETLEGFKTHERTQLTAAFEKVCTVAKWAADIEIYRKTP